jgi:hypothetical protein
MSREGAFVRFAMYKVLVCHKHPGAVYGLDLHLGRHHRDTPISKRLEPIALYEEFHRLPPAEVAQPAPDGLPIDALGPAQDAFLCRNSSSSNNSGGDSSNNRDIDGAVCNFISTSRAKMRQHVNQQHCVKLRR